MTAARSDWRAKRQQREAISRANARQLKRVRADVSRQTKTYLDSVYGELSLSVGYGALFELVSPFRLGSPISTTGVDKKPAEPD
jgi:predicted S18 family serine protease